MPLNNQRSIRLLRISEILYLSLAVLSFYLLIASRAGEAHTVWEVLNPGFIPTLFVTTFLLLEILFTSEKTTQKLCFIIIYSILIHSLFSIIIPAGDLSGQQMVLGQTRRVFDNTILHGLSGWPTATVQTFILEMFEGINLQAALTTIFARMFGVDILYVHLFYIPVLWGAFVPIASFLTSRAIGGSEKASVLSSLLVSAFPYAVYFGAISVPNSLGFIFFFYSLYFMLRHLTSNDSKAAFWMLAFSFFSFLAHFLTGIMSFSLLFLTTALREFENEKEHSTTSARILLMVTFIICASLLPLSFIYLRLLGTSTNPVFTLDKLYELPPSEIVGQFFLGELLYGFDLKTVILVIIGPSFALLYLIYLLLKIKRNSSAKFQTRIYFLFAAFLIMLIDYGILKLFMEGLPINEERLWVFRDFIAVPFVALAVSAVFSSVKGFLKARFTSRITVASLKTLSRGGVLQVFSLLLTLNVLIPGLLGVWIAFSLTAAYPQVAPLQTTWYELEAVKFIEKNTTEKYVVIGDIWTIFAGEVIVGIQNPDAYYFRENDKTGHDLFVNMKQNPSPQWMIQAMNYTDTTVAYFIITEPRVGTEEYNNVVSKALENQQLRVVGTFGDGKLYVFSYEKA